MTTALNQQTFVRARSVVVRVVAGETLVVPVRARVGDLASIYSLSGTASLIWKLLELPRTLAELTAAVVREYEVEVEKANHDVAAFVHEMRAVGLVADSGQVATAGD